MTSRFWIGAGILAAVTAGIGGTALAQDRLQIFGKAGEHAEQGRSRPSAAISANDLMWDFFSPL